MILARQSELEAEKENIELSSKYGDATVKLTALKVRVSELTNEVKSLKSEKKSNARAANLEISLQGTINGVDVVIYGSVRRAADNLNGNSPCLNCRAMLA